jgi:N-acetylglucosamine kinase-like BadF-type ATPase
LRVTGFPCIFLENGLMEGDMEHILAVDGGGTKCEALLMTTEGDALAFHAVYPDKLSVTGDMGRGRNAQAALAAIQSVLKQCNPGGVLHLVGGNGTASYQFRNELKASRVSFWCRNEEEAARACLGVDYALVALAGTGAFGHLHTATVNRHADGFGPVMGDWGSAYQIGREGLRVGMRALLHVHRSSPLLDALARELGGREAEPRLESRLIREGIRIMADRTAVASYAALVDQVARTGDPEAIRILEEASGDLAETLQGLVERAGVGEEALPFVGTGGVIQKSDVYWNNLVQKVLVFLPHARPMRQTLPQAAGLALAGLIQAVKAGETGVDVDRTRARLYESLPGLLKMHERKGAA